MEKAFKAVQKYIDIDSNLAQFVFSNPVNVTQDVVKQLINMIPTTNNGRKGECPKICEEKPLILWRSLYGVFMGLTLATLIFLIAYTVLLKVQFNKFNQKLTSNSLNTS